MRYLYINEGGAPDKLLFDEQNVSNKYKFIVVDRFLSGVNGFKESVNKAITHNNFYSVVCSENQLEYLRSNYPVKFEGMNKILYLKSSSATWDYTRRINVLKISPKYKLRQEVVTKNKVGHIINKYYNNFVIKVDNSSGGRGLFPVTSYPGYKHQWKCADKVTPEFVDEVNDAITDSKYGVIQKLASEGVDDYAVSTLVKNGNIDDFTIIKSIGNKYNPKWTRFLLDHRKETVEYLLPLLNNIIEKLELTDGFFEVECTENSYDKNPKVIEINPRISWTTSMSRYMISNYNPIIRYFGDCPKFCDIAEGIYQEMRVTEGIIAMKDIKYAQST